MRKTISVGAEDAGLRSIINFNMFGPHFFGLITGFIDTGSPITIIGCRDSIKLNIPETMLKPIEAKPIIGMGGKKLMLKKLERGTISFGTDNNERFSIKMPIYVDVDRSNQNSNPTVIGMDFLFINKFKFFVDPANKIAYIED